MKKKKYSEMTTAELRAATAEYDKEWTGPGLPGKPLTAKDRDLMKRITRRGRPVVGAGAKTVIVSFERGLLSRVDDFARRHKLRRSELVAKACAKFIAKAG